jgi:mRNA interferase MazF
MKNDALGPGDVVLIALPLHDPKGHEQEGKRPAIVVGIPQGPVRYPVVIVVPLTTQSGPWVRRNPNLYRFLPPGAGGIPQPSIALLDQLRAVDVRRVKTYLGRLEAEIFHSIRNCLLELLGQEN